MRIPLLSLASLAVAASPALAQEGGRPSLLTPHGGLMFWTLAIFLVLFFILTRFAFKPLIAAVAQREQALEEAIQGAKRDRDEAARLLAEQQRQIADARAEAQRHIAEGRAVSEKLRNDMLDQARAQQQELVERARRDITSERDRAIADLRREAVDLAIAGAGKVIEKNLDEPSNRRLVESYLASLDAPRPGR